MLFINGSTCFCFSKGSFWNVLFMMRFGYLSCISRFQYRLEGGICLEYKYNKVFFSLLLLGYRKMHVFIRL